jgi:hypothetical protein
MRAITIVPAAVLAACFSGCVVAPVPGPGPGYASAEVYVAPTYASPGPGYVWERHPEHGYGWHHPERGWDKGWR